MTSAWNLQQALYAHLQPVLAALDPPVALHDNAPVDAGMPYAEFARHILTPSKGFDHDLSQDQVSLSVFSDHGGQKQVLEILEAIRDSLEDVDLPLPGGDGATILTQYARMDSGRDADGRTYVGSIILPILFRHAPTDPDAQAIIAAFSVPPSEERAGLITALVSALKQAGAWSRWRAFYVSAAADSQAAVVNWRAPGPLNAVPNGTLPFTADRGFFGNGTNGFLSSGFTPSADPGLSPGNVTIFGWSLTYGGVGAAVFEPIAGWAGGGSIQRTNGGLMSAQIASANTASINPSDGFTGLFSASGTGLTGLQNRHYKNGVLRAAGGSPNTISTGVFCGLRNGLTGSLGPHELAAFGIGEYLDEAQHMALYNALRTYLQGVGAVPPP